MLRSIADCHGPVIVDGTVSIRSVYLACSPEIGYGTHFAGMG